jgi:hypothetical protein
MVPQTKADQKLSSRSHNYNPWEEPIDSQQLERLGISAPCLGIIYGFA